MLVAPLLKYGGFIGLSVHRPRVQRGESEKNISVLPEHWDHDCVKD